MEEMGKKPKVLIMKCDLYEPAYIADIIKEGMEELGAIPYGKTMVKPNGVFCHHELFRHAPTRWEFLEGLLMAARQMSQDGTQLSVGERSGITIPTRYVFKQAGFDKVLKRQKVKAVYFDEHRQVPLALDRPESLRKEIFVPQPVAECDFLINAPKFKGHPWSKMTLSLKNYIGIQDDRHRLIDHNSFLEHKIADLQDVLAPGFIAVDAITAGQGGMLAPSPIHLGAIIMGTNPCAVDTVGCSMANVDPRSVVHLDLAAQRGIGPIDLQDIEILGDYPLEEVREKTRNYKSLYMPIDKAFEGNEKVRCVIGTFPEEHSKDYCWGGCPGSLTEMWTLSETFYPDTEERMKKKMVYVVGDVAGDLDVAEDEIVVFAGDCARFEGRLNGKQIKVKGNYATTAQVNPRKAKSNDMLLKITRTKAHALLQRILGRPYIHAKGCPLSVAQLVSYYCTIFGIPDFNFDRRVVFGVNLSYLQMRVNRFFNRIFGRRYHHTRDK
jgi:uncharacterized protein (DUF362 family)